MKKEEILICGTRKKGYKQLVRDTLNKILLSNIAFEIIEGCCPDSADAYAEKFAEDYKITIHHFPSTTGNYLKRNIDMVKKADKIIAFWDNFSYGTCHTIATAIRLNKPVVIIKI